MRRISEYKAQAISPALAHDGGHRCGLAPETFADECADAPLVRAPPEPPILAPVARVRTALPPRPPPRVALGEQPLEPLARAFRPALLVSISVALSHRFVISRRRAEDKEKACS